MKTKYGICVTKEAGYSFDAQWDESDDYGDPVSKSQVIECLKDCIDNFVEFIRASAIVQFIELLQNTNSGDEFYERLCNNVQYIYDLWHKASTISKEISDTFFETVFGKLHSAYSQENACHLVPFENRGAQITDLLKDESSFQKWFNLCLKQSDELLFKILIENVSVYEATIKDVKSHIEMYLEGLKRYKKEVSNYKEYIKRQLERISEIELDEETANWMEEVKRRMK